MSLKDLTDQLEDEIQDPEEETFLLYSNSIPSQNLGMVDPKASSVDVTVGGHDYTIHQSPGLLSSSRAGGTTGAVLWKIAPLFADFLASPSSPLHGTVLQASASVLELGCGISPLNALSLSSLRHHPVSHYTLTDQPYVHRFVTRNIAENQPQPQPQPKQKRQPSRGAPSSSSAQVRFETLDWEADQVTPALAGPSGSFDLVLACDCVYNDALVDPLVQTCVDACQLRSAVPEPVVDLPRENHSDSAIPKPTACVVAQQLRNDEVFQLWLTRFQKSFHVWRFPDSLLPNRLRSNTGFVIHLGILRS